ncbi:MAG: hypothetical protein RIR28_615, partial [Pseudomonadota bacterium]
MHGIEEPLYAIPVIGEQQVV